LVLGHRLALPPPPALIPHRPPPVPRPPRRVHRDPALHLHHHTTVTPRNRAPGPDREGGAASGPWPRRSGRGPGYPGTGWLWVFCGDLGPDGRRPCHPSPPPPPVAQVRRATASFPGGGK